MSFYGGEYFCSHPSSSKFVCCISVFKVVQLYFCYALSSGWGLTAQDMHKISSRATGARLEPNLVTRSHSVIWIRDWPRSYSIFQQYIAKLKSLSQPTD